MRIINRAHLPWAVFVAAAALFAFWLYLGNFKAELLPSLLRLPPSFLQRPSEHGSVGGTPLGLIFGSIALAIFIFAVLLGLRKKLVLWRVGTVQRWMRAHIWLSFLTIPLVLFHSGFRFGGPMTTLLIVLYVVVMMSGIYGLVLQHQMPRIMMERLPAESVYEQIPYIRAQLHAAAQKMRDSLKPVASTPAGEVGPPTSGDGKGSIAESVPMASTAAGVSTPAARAKTTVGSSITAESVRADSGIQTIVSPAPSSAAPAAPSPPGSAADSPAPAAAPMVVKPPPAISDALSEASLYEFLDRQILPYLAARRGDGMRLGNARFSEDTFRFVSLRVAPAYRGRVDQIRAWCEERRMLDLQAKLQHWLHGWIFVHAPVSFLLLMLTFWHAFVTLFHY